MTTTSYLSRGSKHFYVAHHSNPFPRYLLGPFNEPGVAQLALENSEDLLFDQSKDFLADGLSVLGVEGPARTLPKGEFNDFIVGFFHSHPSFINRPSSNKF